MTNDNDPKFEKILNCPLCGGERSFNLFSLPDLLGAETSRKEFPLVQCADCRAIFLSERPKEDFVSTYYPIDYQPFSPHYGYFVNKFIEIRAKKEIGLWNKIYLQKVNKLLDVGCSTGEYIDVVQKNSTIDGRGLDTDRSAVTRCGDRGIHADQGTLETVSYPPETFDVVSMNHVLEHVYEPNHTVREVRRILKPGGIFMIKTPNVDTWERKIFGKYWFPYEVPRHICLFSRKSITPLLLNNGFKIQKLFYEKTPNNIILSIKNYLIYNNYGKKITAFVDINNYFLLLLFLPISFILGLCGRSGRMVVYAVKNRDS